MAGLATAGTAILLTMQCIGPPSTSPPRPPDPMVGVKPWVPPLQSTPSPFWRTSPATATPTPPPAANLTPEPTPQPEGSADHGI